MCMCESDLVKMKLHLITRRYYPGVKYNEPILGRIADELGIVYEKAIRDLPEPEQADLAARVYDRLSEASGAPAGTAPASSRSRGDTTPA